MIARSILGPIEDLALLLDKMVNEDLDVNINMNDNVPKDVERIYQVFTQLRTVLRFNKGTYFGLNEAQALLNYSQALKLFKEFGNMKGQETCTFKIAMIHLKNHRYDEARECMVYSMLMAKQMAEKIDIVYEELVDARTEQLAKILYDMNEANPNKTMTDVIDLLKTVTRKSPDRIFPYILLICALAKDHRDQEAQKYMKEIEDKFVIPTHLLEWVTFCEGLIARSIGKYRLAANKFTDCIEQSTHYDPELRRMCLKELMVIFNFFNIKSADLTRLYSMKDWKVSKDIVMILDYSAYMSGNRIKRAQRGILNIFDQLNDNDRLSLITFQKTINIVFNLSLKSKNSYFIRSAIEKTDRPLGVYAPLYDGLITGLKELSTPRSSLSSSFLELDSSEVSEYLDRWVIVITATHDNCSKYSLKQLCRKLTATNCKLIVLGLCISEERLSTFDSMCESSEVGYFFQCEHSREFKDSFSNMERILFPTDEIREV